MPLLVKGEAFFLFQIHKERFTCYGVLQIVRNWLYLQGD